MSMRDLSKLKVTNNRFDNNISLLLCDCRYMEKVYTPIACPVKLDMSEFIKCPSSRAVYRLYAINVCLIVRSFLEFTIIFFSLSQLFSKTNDTNIQSNTMGLSMADITFPRCSMTLKKSGICATTAVFHSQHPKKR